MSDVYEYDPFGVVGNGTSDSHSNGQNPGTDENGFPETETIEEPHVHESYWDEKDWFIRCKHKSTKFYLILR
jgi:hypothetical protein